MTADQSEQCKRQELSRYYYRPQRSWAKVIFSEACVKNSVHGGGRGWWWCLVPGVSKFSGGVLVPGGGSPNFPGGVVSGPGGSPNFRGGFWSRGEGLQIFGGGVVSGPGGVSKFSGGFWSRGEGLQIFRGGWCLVPGGLQIFGGVSKFSLIRLMSDRYASYWNAFLSIIEMTLICSIMDCPTNSRSVLTNEMGNAQYQPPQMVHLGNFHYEVPFFCVNTTQW